MARIGDQQKTGCALLAKHRYARDRVIQRGQSQCDVHRALCVTLPSRNAQQGIDPLIPHASEYMQAIGKLRLFDITDETINAGQCLALINIVRNPQILFHTQGLRQIADLIHQAITAFGVQSIGIGKFVQQVFQWHKGIGRVRLRKGRWNMPQCQSRNTAFGLCGLARIIDDERINDGDIPRQCIGPTRIGQRHGFTGQPFQRPMRPDMHHGICVHRLKPQIKRDIAMAGRARQIVIIVITRFQPSSFRL